jgi:hypothetical protein
MLQDLKRKDPFYETYVKTSEELTKLRQAHAILISMIKSNQLNLKKQEESGSFSGVDKFELQVPINQKNYRGGNSINLQKQTIQTNFQTDGSQPMFCGFGANAQPNPTNNKGIQK